MKKLITTALFIMLITIVYGQITFTFDGIKYTTNGTSTVKVVSNNYSGDISIPFSVNFNDTAYTVTSIGDYAFYYCYLTSITMPNSVTSIGDWAFSGCSSLTSISIPNSVTLIGYYAFYFCSSLTSITIPNSVTTINPGAFWNCFSLTSITIPNSVTSIRRSTFSGCRSLTSITIPNSVTSIEGSAFWGCSSLTSITIPNSVTSIESQAFAACSSLTSITIPNSVTSIGDKVFSGCRSLTQINVDTSNSNYSSIGGVLFNKDQTILMQYHEVKTSTSYTIPNSVTSIGKAAFIDCSSLTSIIIPNSVTSIESWAFSGCSSLTSITLPNSVTSIESRAFYDCSSLTSITLPNSVDSIGSYTFANCSSLTSITLPNSVTSIEGSAFWGCSSLTSITLPNSVTSIGYNPFGGCINLTQINVDTSNSNYSSIGGVLFNKDQTILIQYPIGNTSTSYTIPNSVTSIGNGAFFECSSLTSIAIPNSVTSIESYAFCYCNSLTSITLPNSVTSIGSRAFSYCNNLNQINIDTSNFNYSSIGGVLFNKDQTILIQYPTGKTSTSYTIPNSVASIGDGAFWNCRNLTSIAIPNSVDSIENSAFSGCSSLTSITIPNSVTSIGSRAFQDCSSLTSITIPNSVTSIRGSTFSGCRSLTSITIPNSVTSIEGSAFWGCSSLTSIAIPNSVDSIGSYPFAGCSSLTTIYAYSVTPIDLTLSENVFSNYDKVNCTLYVPTGSKALYQAAPKWKDFRNIIEFKFNTISNVSPGIGFYHDDYTDLTILAYPVNPDSKLILVSGTFEISPDSIIKRDSNSIKARFSWKNKIPAIYDIVLISPDNDTLKLVNGFLLQEAKLSFNVWNDFEVRQGNKFVSSVWVPVNTKELFVFVKKSSRIGYSDSWAGKVKIIKDGKSKSVTANNYGDFSYYESNPESGYYAFEIEATYNEGAGKIIFTDSPPVLPLNEWSKGEILRPYGEDWKKVIVPTNTTALSLQTEGYGMWSSIDVYFDKITNVNEQWQFSNEGENGYKIKGQIKNPKAGTYYIKYVDSAVLYGDGNSDEDVQKRNYMIFAGLTTSIPSSPQPLSIVNLSTYNVGQGPVTIEVTGTGFDPTSVAGLFKEGKDTIFATNVLYDSTLRKLSVSFDLSSTEVGEYKLWVKNNNAIVISEKLISIENNTASNLSIEIIGRDKLRVGRNQNIIFEISNQNNINVKDLAVYIFIPNTIISKIEYFSSEYSVGLQNDLQENNGYVIYFKELIPYQKVVLNMTIKTLFDIGKFDIQYFGILGSQSNNKLLKKARDESNVISEKVGHDVWWRVNLAPNSVSNSQHSVWTFPDRDEAYMTWSNGGKQYIESGTINYIYNLLSNSGLSKCEICSGIKEFDKNNSSSFRDELKNIVGIEFDYSDTNPKDIWGKNSEGNCVGLGEGAAERAKFPTKEGFVDSNSEMNSFTLQRDIVNFFGGNSNFLPEVFLSKLSKSDKDFLNTKFSEYLKFYGIISVKSTTPEDKYGTTGFGKGGSISKDQKLTYRVDFWNHENATTNAQEVFIKDTLDVDFNDKTLNFTEVGFLKWKLPLDGGQYFKVNVDMRPDMNIIVNAEGKYDPKSREISWVFRSLDPVTLDYPEDPLAGFLPPIDSTGYQIGWVEYSINSNNDIQDGTTLTNRAWVNFDGVGPTNPAPKEAPWSNMIDDTPPESFVIDTLPAVVYADSVLVSWQGTDAGSGIKNYTIYFSENNIDFTPWLNDFTGDSAYFFGKNGKTYYFYSISTDNVGLAEPQKKDFEAMVTFNFTTGINDVSNKPGDGDIFIYPNPAECCFRVVSMLNCTSAKTIDVFNSMGKRILQKQFDSNEITVDLSNHAKGIYYVTVTCDKKQVSKKVITN